MRKIEIKAWLVLCCLFNVFQFLISQSALVLETEMNLDKVFPADFAPNTWKAQYLFDHKNVLWYTNYDQGLYEYDGEHIRFHPFKIENANKNAHVECFEILENGVFVTESSDGVLICDPRNFDVYPFLEKFKGKRDYGGFKKLMPLGANKIMIKNFDFVGIVEIKLMEDSLQISSSQFNNVFLDSLYDLQIINFTKGVNNNFWGYGWNYLVELKLGDEGFNLKRVDSLGFLKERFQQPQVRSVAQIKEDLIILAGECAKTQEIFVFAYNLDSKDYEPLPTFNLKGAGYVPQYDKIIVNFPNEIWISFYGSNILRYDFDINNDSIQILNVHSIEPDIKYPQQKLANFSTDVFKDLKGGLWIQSMHGLVKYHPSLSKFKATYLPPSNKDEKIFNIHVNRNSNFLDIQTSNELIRFDGYNSFEPIIRLSKEKQYGNDGALNQARIYSDSLSIGTSSYPHGIYKFHSIINSAFGSVKDQLFTELLLGDIYMDDFGEIWTTFSANEENAFGYLWYDPQTHNWLKIHTQDTDDYYAQFIRLGTDTLAVFKGWNLQMDLYKINKEQGQLNRLSHVKRIELPDYIPSFKKGKEKNILLSSRNGSIYNWRLKTQSFTKIIENLPDGQMVLMYEESDTSLWVQTKNKGHIFYCNTKSKKCEYINDYFGDRLKLDNFIGNFSRNINGNILIPQRGIYYEFVKPNKISKFKATPLIQSVKYHSKSDDSLHWNRLEPISKKTFHYAHNIRELKIEFCAAHYKDVDKNSYSYRLVGYDNSWSKPNTSGEALYSYIPPGQYTFQLKAANSDSIWSEEITEMKFRILAPWYWSWWSKSIYAASSFGFLFLIYGFAQKRRDEKQESRRLKQMDELRTRLYTNITHEFRTPLTVIQGMAEDVFDNLPKTQKQKLGTKLQMIRRNGDDLLGLVNQMLDLDKLESGNFQVHYEQSDIIPYIHYLTDSFSSMAELKNIQITFYSEIESLVMDYDTENFRKVIFNLFSNAIKYTPEGGNVICHVNRIKEEEEFCVVKIKDTGIGIPAKELEKIFNRFYRVLEDGEDSGSGSGIGLALTKELMQMMKADISVVSKPGFGTEFTLKFPVRNEAAFAVVNPINLKKRLDNELKNEFIPKELAQDLLPTALVVEDNRDVAAYIALCLRRRYNVIHAIDGEDGILKAFEEMPDIIISDVMMPKQDGYQLVKKLKDDERTSHIPIILLTAKSGFKHKLEGLQKGADAYLIKPFNRDELIVRMEQLIGLRNKLRKKYSILNRKENSFEKTADPQDKFVNKAVKLVETNLADPEFGAENLAKDLNLSVSQTYRKIKFLTGKSTAVFIRWVRLQHSLEMLENTERNISEVAYACGFKDPSWFSRAFKEEFGYPPSGVVK